MRLGALGPLLTVLLAAGCNDDGPAGNVRNADGTVTLADQESAELVEPLDFVLHDVAGVRFAALDALGPIFLEATSHRVSEVGITTNLRDTPAERNFFAVAFDLVYRNLPPSSLPGSRGVIAFQRPRPAEPYRDFIWAHARQGENVDLPSQEAGLAIVSGSAANGHAGTLHWLAFPRATAGIIDRGSTGEPCRNAAAVASTAPGVECTVHFYRAAFALESEPALSSAPGTKSASLAGTRIIGVRLAVDCAASAFC